MSCEPGRCSCGCCDGVHPVTPQSEENAPGLFALAYRAGTHGAFVESMHASISAQPSLRIMKSRSNDDASVALIDAWATVLDVLTFYQERIANEGYLRTSIERPSILQLARAIGYELGPGVAASTVLAFNLETAPGAPRAAAIPVGTKAQSIPGENESAQTFETVEAIASRVEWNAMTLRTSQPQALAIAAGAVLYAADPSREARVLMFAGTQTALQADDTLLVVCGSDAAAQTASKRVTRVSADSARNVTRVEIEASPGTPDSTPFPAAPSGYDVMTLPPDAAPIPFSAQAVAAFIFPARWRETDLQTFLSVNKWDADDLRTAAAGLAAAGVAGQSVHALRDRAGFFGSTAPLYDSLTKLTVDAASAIKSVPLYAPSWDSPQWSIWRAYPSPTAYYGNGSSPDLWLDRQIKGIAAGSWMLVEQGGTRQSFRVASTADAALAAFGMSGRSTGLRLTAPDGSAPSKSDTITVRSAVAHVRSEELPLAALPIDDLLPAQSTVITFDRMILGLQHGQLLALRGEQADAAAVLRSEVLVIEEIIHFEGNTTVRFHTGPSQGLQYAYRASTVIVNGNVARATHGETKSEVLASGDASRAWQRAKLRQKPLTYTSAATPSGGKTTLSLRVNGLLWNEASSFFRMPADARAFTTRRADDGTVTVGFGDGIRGRRLPTGIENVTVQYRTGTGLAGNVARGQISMLLSKPLGVKDAGNPVPASGGADPETRDEARRNAPLTVLTLDRIVSLQDFTDFARAFAGIGKALATWLWNGEHAMVFITVAASGGAAVDASSELAANLLAAIESSRDPGARVQLGTFDARYFNVACKVLPNPAYVKEHVFAAATAAIATAFSFDARGFGQAVTRSELEALIQRVNGVDAVDLDSFFIAAIGDTGADMLPAQTAHWDDALGRPAPAQLLLVNPREISVTEMLP